MTPLRVLHVVPHLDRIGGYERQALALARAQRRGGRAQPILLTHGEARACRFEDRDAGEVHRLDRGLRRYHPGRWWRTYRRRIDVVHAHALHKLSGQVLALGIADGVPGLVKVASPDDVRMFTDPHGWEGLLDGTERPPTLRWRLSVQRAWLQLRRAGTFVALNRTVQRELAEQGLRHVVVPNGVDLERFRPPATEETVRARRRLGLPDEGPVVAYAGRLAERKDVPTLVDGFAFLAARQPPAHLVIGGQGPSHGRIVDALQRHGFRQQGDDRGGGTRWVTAGGSGGTVHLVGPVTDVRTVLHAATVFVHPSTREGLPNVVLEAWACGCATILSDIPAHREAAERKAPAAVADPMADPVADSRPDAAADLVANPAADPVASAPPARLVPPSDPGALASALGELLATPAARRHLRLAGRRHVQGRFGLDAVTARYESLYRSLLEDAPGAVGARRAPG